MFKAILQIISILALLVAALSLPISVGMGLFWWAEGTTLALAAWGAFKIWLSCLLGGGAIYGVCFAASSK